MCHRVNQLLLYISILKGDILPEDEASEFTPENGWLELLEYDRFLLGPGQFSGAFPVSFRECKTHQPNSRDGHQPNRWAPKKKHKLIETGH